MIEVRAFGPDEGALLKRTRLAALSDSPGAFSSTLAEERRLPDAHWTALVQGVGRFAGSRSFLAARRGTVLAMAGCYPETPDRYRLVAMWVRPRARREKVGAMLVDAIAAWVVECRGSELVVGVFELNAPAVAFYRAQGFTPAAPIDHGGSHGDDRELQLSLRLTE